MDQQDEGRINPDETDASRETGAISEFARLEEESEHPSAEHAALAAEEAFHQKRLAPEGNDLECAPARPWGEQERDNPAVMAPDGEFIPAISLPEELPGDGGATHAARESRDITKLRYDLIPADFLEFLARIFTYGASKYDDWNWLKGLSQSETYACAMRHLQKWWAGENNDEDYIDADGNLITGSGLSHLWHALWNIGVMAYFERHRPDLDDRGINEPRLVANIYTSDKDPTFQVEIQLPADDSNEGFIFAQQGGGRSTIEQARAVLQALRDDGYDLRVMRIVRTADRIVEFTDGTTEIDGLISGVVQTVFPGDPVLA